MKSRYTVTGLSILFALFVWFADMALDYFVLMGGSF